MAEGISIKGIEVEDSLKEHICRLLAFVSFLFRATDSRVKVSEIVIKRPKKKQSLLSSIFITYLLPNFKQNKLHKFIEFITLYI